MGAFPDCGVALHCVHERMQSTTSRSRSSNLDMLEKKISWVTKFGREPVATMRTARHERVVPSRIASRDDPTTQGNSISRPFDSAYEPFGAVASRLATWKKSDKPLGIGLGKVATMRAWRFAS